MKTFDILTVSKRTGWEQQAFRSVGNQTVLPHNWIIVSESMIDSSIVSSGRYEISWLQAPAKKRPSNLNASLNEGLRYVDADYVIFYQDFIELPKDCFEKLLALADEKTFVTTCTPNYDNSDDGRYTGFDAPRKCQPQEWEANVAIAPMKIIRELGGFDERYDNGWSWDNVNLAERAEMLGCKFIIDESNRPKLYPHETQSLEGLTLNGDRHAHTMNSILKGTQPLKLSYLNGEKEKCKIKKLTTK